MPQHLLKIASDNLFTWPWHFTRRIDLPSYQKQVNLDYTRT